MGLSLHRFLPCTEAQEKAKWKRLSLNFECYWLSFTMGGKNILNKQSAEQTGCVAWTLNKLVPEKDPVGTGCLSAKICTRNEKDFKRIVFHTWELQVTNAMVAPKIGLYIISSLCISSLKRRQASSTFDIFLYYYIFIYSMLFYQFLRKAYKN